MNFTATTSCPTKSPVRSSVASSLHPLFAPRSPHTPSLPDAHPRSDRFRCGGRESKFLAVGRESKFLAVIRKGPAGGSIHGGEDETAVMLHYGYPIDTSLYTDVDHVHYHTDYIAGDNFIGSTKVFWSTWNYNPSKTGLLGDPTPATAETGKVLVEACVKHLAAFVEEYWKKR